MRRIAVMTGMLAIGLAVTASGIRAQSKEVDMDATMKKIGPAFAALRKSIEAMDPDLAKENAAILRTSFADTERFFESKGKHDGHGWAGDARKAVESVETALAASKWDDVKGAAGNLGKTCNTCHMTYREKAEDGTYRMKPGN